MEATSTLPQQLQRLESLLQQAERQGNPAAQARLRGIVQAVLDVHRAGLARILEYIAAAGPAGQTVLDACVADELAAGLLLLHDLHPWDLESRVRQALADVEAQQHTQVELLDLADGVVRLRLAGGEGRPSSATLRQHIVAAIQAQAPDAVVEIKESADQLAVGRAGAARFALPLV